MWKKVRPMLPHAAILLANAYVVFFLIDRVNTSMNFIDNELTKGMLLVMCLLAIGDWRIAKVRARRAQMKKAAKRPLAKGNPAGRNGT